MKKKNLIVLSGLSGLLIAATVTGGVLYFGQGKPVEQAVRDRIIAQEQKGNEPSTVVVPIEEKRPVQPQQSELENKLIKQPEPYIPDNIPTSPPLEAPQFNGVPKVDIKKISRNKIEQLGFTLTPIDGGVTYNGKIGEDYVEIEILEGNISYVVVAPFDVKQPIPKNLNYIQYGSISHTNEIMVNDSKMKDGVDDARNVVFNPDGSFQYATKRPDQSTLKYYEKICNIVKKLI